MLDLPLCKVLLFDDTNYPCWLVLVPRRVRSPPSPPPFPSPSPPGPVRGTRRTPSCCPLVGLTTRSWFRAPRSAGGRQNGLREMHDLPEGGQLQLMREISQCSRALQDLFKPTKMNVAAIGNMSTQLHIHVTCRVEGDPSWPGPCYGLPRTEYSPEALAEALSRLRAALA